MTTTMQDRREALDQLEPRLRAWADALTHDAAEAHALVDETLAIARTQRVGPPDADALQAWLFRLLRQRFHSLERGQDYRRSRRSLAAEKDFARKRLIAALGQTAQA